MKKKCHLNPPIQLLSVRPPFGSFEHNAKHCGFSTGSASFFCNKTILQIKMLCMTIHVYVHIIGFHGEESCDPEEFISMKEFIEALLIIGFKIYKQG